MDQLTKGSSTGGWIWTSGIRNGMSGAGADRDVYLPNAINHGPKNG